MSFQLLYIGGLIGFGRIHVAGSVSVTMCISPILGNNSKVSLEAYILAIDISFRKGGVKFRPSVYVKTQKQTMHPLVIHYKTGFRITFSHCKKVVTFISI